jgi:1,2-diacylglycerol 3-alpha-glucosyltransferase
MMGKLQSIREKTRLELDIKNDEIVFVTGGKIDRAKNVHVLVNSLLELEKAGKIAKFKVLVFGTPSEDLIGEFERYRSQCSVRILGWQASQDIFKLLICADCVVFLGTHSVLWEAALGLGLPAVFKKWPGMGHLDWGGNCIVIDKPNLQNVSDVMLRLLKDPCLLKAMKVRAESESREMFKYSRIAEAALEKGYDLGPFIDD